MIRNTICAGGVVVDQTEVISGACEHLSDLTELVEALRNGPRLARTITLRDVYGLPGL